MLAVEPHGGAESEDEKADLDAFVAEFLTPNNTSTSTSTSTPDAYEAVSIPSTPADPAPSGLTSTRTGSECADPASAVRASSDGARKRRRGTDTKTEAHISMMDHLCALEAQQESDFLLAQSLQAEEHGMRGCLYSPSKRSPTRWPPCAKHGRSSPSVSRHTTVAGALRRSNAEAASAGASTGVDRTQQLDEVLVGLVMAFVGPVHSLPVNQRLQGIVVRAVRGRIVKLFVTSAGLSQSLAEETETAVFEALQRSTGRKYLSRTRTLVFNLKRDPGELRAKLVSGLISPGDLATMTRDELASRSRTRQRERERKQGECRLSRRARVTLRDTHGVHCWCRHVTLTLTVASVLGAGVVAACFSFNSIPHCMQGRGTSPSLRLTRGQSATTTIASVAVGEGRRRGRFMRPRTSKALPSWCGASGVG